MSDNIDASVSNNEFIGSLALTEAGPPVTTNYTPIVWVLVGLGLCCVGAVICNVMVCYYIFWKGDDDKSSTCSQAGLPLDENLELGEDGRPAVVIGKFSE